MPGKISVGGEKLVSLILSGVIDNAELMAATGMSKRSVQWRKQVMRQSCADLEREPFDSAPTKSKKKKRAPKERQKKVPKPYFDESASLK